MLGTDSKIEGFKSKTKECSPVDFNGDERINIIDFSILIYWFGQFEPPDVIDLNDDGIVDLFDFSIMAYCWTG